MTKLQPPNAQHGAISEKPREHLLLAALTLVGADVPGRRSGMERLRALVSSELHSHLADDAIETGELGFDDGYDRYRLVVSLALSSSGYDRLNAALDERPVDLHPMPADVLNPDSNLTMEIAAEGDVLLHIASDDIVIVEHVLRRIEHELPDAFSLAWVQSGVQRYNTRQSGSAGEQRALLGFLDGSNNLRMSDPAHRRLVFVDPEDANYPANPPADGGSPYGGATFPLLPNPPIGPEPACLKDGAYLAIEILLNATIEFDQLAQSQQEQIVGRAKVDGGQTGNAVPSSHVLKANPHRDANDDERRLLRRGYNLLRPHGNRLARGLVFIAFCRSLTCQAEFVRRAWINNANFPSNGAGRDQLIFGHTTPLGGGYYFVPPLKKASDPASWVLPEGPES